MDRIDMLAQWFLEATAVGPVWTPICRVGIVMFGIYILTSLVLSAWRDFMDRAGPRQIQHSAAEHFKAGPGEPA